MCEGVAYFYFKMVPIVGTILPALFMICRNFGSNSVYWVQTLSIAF